MMDKNGIPCKNWQDRACDSFTEWRDEYKHRGMCYAEGGFCEECDSDEKLRAFQDRLFGEVELGKRFASESARLLLVHIAKWGDKRTMVGKSIR